MNQKRQRYLSAFSQTILIFLGNTFGIWFTYIVVNFLFIGIKPDITWPGLESFIIKGDFHIITFSVLTTVIMTTSEKLTVNWYNGLALALLFVSTFFYIRCIGLNGRDYNLLAGYLPFLLSTLLLFFALKDKRNLFRKYSWLKNAKNQEYDYDVFLSFAIAGNKNQSQRDEIEKFIAQIDSTLKECGYKSIFNASKYFDQEHHKTSPAEAAQEDFSAVENSKNFILFYPMAIPTSALMELGYAIRDRKNILLISKNSHTLPFLARGIAEIHENVRTLFYDDFNDIIQNLRRHHSQYLKK